MADQRSYGNTSSQQNTLHIKYAVAVGPNKPTKKDYQVSAPDCISCLKHTLGVPKDKQCQAICREHAEEQFVKQANNEFYSDMQFIRDGIGELTTPEREFLLNNPQTYPIISDYNNLGK
jgi:hypothetical protein